MSETSFQTAPRPGKEKQPLLSFMRIGDINAWLKKKNIPALDHANHNKWVAIEETKPYDVLTPQNVYILVDAVRAMYPANTVRDMECTVTTHMTQARWMQVVDTSKYVL